MHKGLDELPWNSKGTENCYREQNRKCEYLYLNPRFLLQFSKRCKLQKDRFNKSPFILLVLTFYKALLLTSHFSPSFSYI